MPEVVDTAAGDQVVPLGQSHFPDQVFQKCSIDLFVVDQSNRFSFSPILYSFFNFFSESDGFVIIQIIFGILGHFDDVGRILIVTEIRKNSWQAKPDHIFQQNDIMSLICPGWQQNES